MKSKTYLDDLPYFQLPVDRVNDLDRQIIQQFDSCGDDRRAFIAFKEDKSHSETIAEMVRRKKEELDRYPRSQKQKDLDIDHDSLIPKVKQADYSAEKRDWNPNLEPTVLIPRPFQAKLNSERVDQQTSILERMQKALELHTTL